MSGDGWTSNEGKSSPLCTRSTPKREIDGAKVGIFPVKSKIPFMTQTQRRITEKARKRERKM